MTKKILVVDDAILIRRIVISSLSARDYEFMEAVNGRDALKKVTEMEFDLVISDINMPYLSGLEFVQEIRNKIPSFNTPILMLTSDSKIEQVKLAKSLGVTGWIIKPFTADLLLKSVDRILNLDKNKS